MIKKELETRLEESFAYAEEILVKNGKLIPMFEIEFIDEKDKKNIIMVGLALDDNNIKRNKFIKGLGLMFGAYKRMGKIKEVVCVVMTSEAWISYVTKEEYKLKHGKVGRPSEDPDRKEMLIVSGLTSDGICLLKAKEMITIEVKGKRHFSLNEFPEEFP